MFKNFEYFYIWQLGFYGINENLIIKNKFNFIENIFSIKNDVNKRHKILTFLGVHIKIRRKK